MRLSRTAAALVLVLTLAGCAGDDVDPEASEGSAEVEPTNPATSESPESPVATTTAPPSESPTSTPQETTAPGTTITTGDSPFGSMLFDADDQAIYIWEREPTDEPTCYDDCEAAWPPVLTDGEPVATGDVRPRLLGTTKRRDGSVQVTYGGHPLYYYAHEAPGEVKCHNVATHGGLWWVVRPDGNRA